MPEISKILADNVRRLREQNEWTQERLAEKSGLSVSAIRAYENERRWPEKPYISAIAAALKCDESKLFEVKSPPSKEEIMRKRVIGLALNANAQELEGALSAFGDFEETTDSLSTAK